MADTKPTKAQADAIRKDDNARGSRNADPREAR